MAAGRRHGARPLGTSLPELLATLVVLGVLASASVRYTVQLEALARAQRDRAARVEAAWTVWAVLAAELRPLRPERDLSGVSDDSVRARFFRGQATVCGADAGAVLVEYRGVRHPDPRKDSVLVVGAPGEPVAPVLGVGSGTCPGVAGRAVRIRAPLPPGARHLLLFETGSYHLSGRAFRYRRGRGGRQPLTGELFDDRATGFAPSPSAGRDGVRALVARLTALASASAEPGAPWSARRRLPLLNVDAVPEEGS